MLKVNNIDFDTDAEDYEFLAKFHETLRRNDCLSTIANLFDEVWSRSVPVDDITLYEPVIDIFSKLENFKISHKEDKTAKLWLMYIEMINIVCKVIKAQRTGNRLLHLLAVSEILPFFASSGHYLYAKSA